jgi:hypothetical protein
VKANRSIATGCVTRLLWPRQGRWRSGRHCGLGLSAAHAVRIPQRSCRHKAAGNAADARRWPTTVRSMLRAGQGESCAIPWEVSPRLRERSQPPQLRQGYKDHARLYAHKHPGHVLETSEVLEGIGQLALKTGLNPDDTWATHGLYRRVRVARLPPREMVRERTYKAQFGSSTC